MKKETKKTKLSFLSANQRGSVLAFSLVVMFILLIVSIGMATVSSKELKSSSITRKSVTAFQIADSGAERVMEKIYDEECISVLDLKNVGMSCSGGVISENVSDGEYNLTFKKAGGADITDCNDEEAIISIKSVGKYEGTIRAVEISF